MASRMDTSKLLVDLIDTTTAIKVLAKDHDFNEDDAKDLDFLLRMAMNLKRRLQSQKNNGITALK